MARPLIPVTILTGFLGSGKTTLLNHILTQRHGRRIAVVENEFGSVGIDNALVVGATEEVVEMNNGCLCCSVREDLVAALEKLAKKREKFDYVVIETSGLADPGPVMTTFLLHEGLQKSYQVDAIVTVVDARHVAQHLGTSPECERQIGFADVVLLNKTDLATPEELASIERRIRAVNRAASVHRTTHGVIEPSRIVGLRAFDLDNKKAFDGALLDAEPPYSWAAHYRLDVGTYELHFATAAHDHQGVVILPLHATSGDAFSASLREAATIFEGDPVRRSPGEALASIPFKQRLSLPADGTAYCLGIERAGDYAFFGGHAMAPYGFSLRRGGEALAPLSEQSWEDDGSHAPAEVAGGHSGAGSGHRHDPTVRSVGIVEPRAVDGDLLSTWLGTLLQRRGNDIYRMKGIFHVQGSSHRFVFQGVHMLFEGKPDREWRKDEVRQNQLVFIGRNLDPVELERGFRACLALGI